jgi:hypothetical protein
MSRDHVESHSSPIGPSAGISAKILTFRTITTLLEILQDPSLNPKSSYPVRVDDHASLQGQRHLQTNQHSDHRSLCALATLLVRNHHDVTAVAMQDRSTSDPLVEVLVCRHDSNPSPRIVDNAAPGPADSRPVVDTPEPNRDYINVHPDPLKMDVLHPTQYLMDTWYALETFKDESS